MAEGAWQPAAQDKSPKKGRPKKLVVGQSGRSSALAGEPGPSSASTASATAGPATRPALIAHFQVKKFILKKHFFNKCF